MVWKEELCFVLLLQIQEAPLQKYESLMMNNLLDMTGVRPGIYQILKNIELANAVLIGYIDAIILTDEKI